MPQPLAVPAVDRRPDRPGLAMFFAAEHPAEVGVDETAHSAAPPGRLIDVRAVRVAGT